METENNKKILWLIVARSGSKSVPDKNIKMLGGMPLLVYRIKSALTIAPKEDVWISTDSEKYADIARLNGATVPFIRPKELATDTAKGDDVVMHAVQWAEREGRHYDAIGLLEPTSPFITPDHLVEGVKALFSTPEAENIVAVRLVRPHSMFVQPEARFLATLAKAIKRHGALRRQDLAREVTPSGGFYISKWESFRGNGTFYTEKTLSYLVPDANGLEIDEPLDWFWAEFLIEKGIIHISDIVERKPV